MEREKLWHELEEKGVIRHDQHIVLSSRLHTPDYASFVPAGIHLSLRQSLLDELEYIARRSNFYFAAPNHRVVLSTGCANWYASGLADRYEAPWLYAEKDGADALLLRRNQARHLTGATVLIVDDAIVTGQSLRALTALAFQNEAGSVFVATLLDRGQAQTKNLQFFSRAVPVVSVFHKPMPTWEKAMCPQCRAGVPFSTQHGKGPEEFHRYGQPEKAK